MSSEPSSFEHWRSEWKTRLHILQQAVYSLNSLGPPPQTGTGQEMLDLRRSWHLPPGQPATAAQIKEAADRLLAPAEAAKNAIAGHMQAIDNHLAAAGRRGDKAVVSPELLPWHLVTTEVVQGLGSVVFGTP